MGVFLKVPRQFLQHKWLWHICDSVTGDRFHSFHSFVARIRRRSPLNFPKFRVCLSNGVQWLTWPINILGGLGWPRQRCAPVVQWSIKVLRENRRSFHMSGELATCRVVDLWNFTQLGSSLTQTVIVQSPMLINEWVLLLWVKILLFPYPIETASSNSALNCGAARDTMIKLSAGDATFLPGASQRLEKQFCRKAKGKKRY